MKFFMVLYTSRRKRRNKRLIREFSSAGRASALQAGGHRFEPCNSHHYRICFQSFVLSVRQQRYGFVVQLVRTPPCHGGGRGFESHRSRHFASVAQSVEQRTENPRVVGSIPTGGTNLSCIQDMCGISSSGRARPCQGRGSGFEPRIPLQQ